MTNGATNGLVYSFDAQIFIILISSFAVRSVIAVVAAVVTGICNKGTSVGVDICHFFCQHRVIWVGIWKTNHHDASDNVD